MEFKVTNRSDILLEGQLMFSINSSDFSAIDSGGMEGGVSAWRNEGAIRKSFPT